MIYYRLEIVCRYELYWGFQPYSEQGVDPDFDKMCEGTPKSVIIRIFIYWFSNHEEGWSKGFFKACLPVRRCSNPDCMQSKADWEWSTPPMTVIDCHTTGQFWKWRIFSIFSAFGKAEFGHTALRCAPRRRKAENRLMLRRFSDFPALPAGRWLPTSDLSQAE